MIRQSLLNRNWLRSPKNVNVPSTGSTQHRFPDFGPWLLVYTSCYVRSDGKCDREKSPGYQMTIKMVRSVHEVARCTNLDAFCNALLPQRRKSHCVNRNTQAWERGQCEALSKKQEIYRRLGGTCCIQFPRRWSKCIPSKSWYQFPWLYAALAQNTTLWTFSAFKILNL